MTHFRKRHKISSSKGGKGLRYYATVVCEKVKTKGITSYSEVADELVNEYAAEFPCPGDQQVLYYITLSLFMLLVLNLFALNLIELNLFALNRIQLNLIAKRFLYFSFFLL